MSSIWLSLLALIQNAPRPYQDEGRSWCHLGSLRPHGRSLREGLANLADSRHPAC